MKSVHRPAVLAALKDGPKTTPEIMKALGIQRSGFVNLLDTMSFERLIRRRGKVGGAYRWEITERGRAVISNQ